MHDLQVHLSSDGKRKAKNLYTELNDLGNLSVQQQKCKVKIHLKTLSK